MWNLQITDTPPVCSSGRVEKYAAVRQAIVGMPANKWLCITGFADEVELDQMQSSIKSSQIARRMGISGVRVSSRREVSNGKLALWVQKILPAVGA